MPSETLDPYDNFPSSIPLLAEHEWAHIPEKDTLNTAGDAAMYLYLTARSLCNVPVRGINVGSSQLPDNGYDAHTRPWDFAIDLEDDLGGKFTIDGVSATGQTEYPHLTSTSVGYSTPIAEGKMFTSVAYREESQPAQGAQPGTTKYRYSVSKYEDRMTDGGYEPQLTRTKPDELSKADAAAAEKKYVELTNQFKVALELKLARSHDPDKIRRLNNQYELYQERKSSQAEAQVSKTRKFMRKLHLTSR
jgi:hypothetical protein